MPAKNKSPNLAFFLNFILPGAGLLYLRKPAWAAANFFAVLLLGFVLAFSLPEELFDNYIRYIAMGIAGGSGGLGMAVANQMNATDESSKVE